MHCCLVKKPSLGLSRGLSETALRTRTLKLLQFTRVSSARKRLRPRHPSAFKRVKRPKYNLHTRRRGFDGTLSGTRIAANPEPRQQTSIAAFIQQRRAGKLPSVVQASLSKTEFLNSCNKELIFRTKPSTQLKFSSAAQTDSP